MRNALVLTSLASDRCPRWCVRGRVRCESDLLAGSSGGSAESTTSSGAGGSSAGTSDTSNPPSTTTGGSAKPRRGVQQRRLRATTAARRTTPAPRTTAARRAAVVVQSGGSAADSGIPSSFAEAGAPGSWENITPPAPEPWANGSAFYYGFQWIDGAKPDAPGTLYVGLDHGADQYSGVWKTTDGGNSWAAHRQPRPEGRAPPAARSRWWSIRPTPTCSMSAASSRASAFSSPPMAAPRGPRRASFLPATKPIPTGCRLTRRTTSTSC